MVLTAAMPYFIKPSVNLSPEAKRTTYAEAEAAILAALGDEQDELVKMVTVNALLKTFLPYYYWAGFYLKRGEDQLIVGPYQGTFGCLTIPFGRGVCGTAAATGKTQIVADTHTLTPGKEHIVCDPNSRSEIVVPVYRSDGSFLGVFDVDSTETGSFDAVDQEALEALLARLF
ncbi:MAG: GAF domain-containing protein [Bacteroidota bacterium]